MWKLNKCANGRLTCDNCQKTADDITDIIKLLEKGFETEYDDKSCAHLDTFAADLLINSKKITIGYDNWFGAFIMSGDPDSDKIVQMIYEYLEKTDQNLSETNY